MYRAKDGSLCAGTDGGAFSEERETQQIMTPSS